MATKSEIDHVLAILIAAYPYMQKDNGANMAATLQVYHRTLADIDAPALLAAALDHISRSKFFPSVSELRDAAYRVVTLNQPSPEEAWGEVKAAFRRWGYTGKPEWSHPAIEATVKIMGWRELCQSENEVADRAHFLRIYASVEQRHKDNALMLPEIRNLTLKLSANKPMELKDGHDERSE